MADRALHPDTPELRARWGGFAARTLKLAIALPLIALMVGFAKAAQFASVAAYGDTLGFNLASLLGVAPVIGFYYFAAVKLPRFDKAFSRNG